MSDVDSSRKSESRSVTDRLSKNEKVVFTYEQKDYLSEIKFYFRVSVGFVRYIIRYAALVHSGNAFCR